MPNNKQAGWRVVVFTIPDVPFDVPFFSHFSLIIKLPTAQSCWGRMSCHSSHWRTYIGQRLRGSFYMQPPPGLASVQLQGIEWDSTPSSEDAGSSDTRTCRLNFEDMCVEADEQLFNRLINNTNHVIHSLLPPPATGSQNYNLRHRVHTLQLPEHSTRLSDSNFLVRLLYRDCY